MFGLSLPDTHFQGKLSFVRDLEVSRSSRQDDFALVLLEEAAGEQVFLTEDSPKDSHFEVRTAYDVETLRFWGMLEKMILFTEKKGKK